LDESTSKTYIYHDGETCSMMEQEARSAIAIWNLHGSLIDSYQLSLSD
jgi:hypothetical protein